MTRNAKLLVITPGLLALSCTHQTRSSLTPATLRQPSAMERQIRNAVDAGDGDFVAATLREAMAAHPENERYRLDLAEHYQRLGFPDLALEHYRLAAERFPQSAEVELRLVKTLRAAGQSAEAVQSLAAFLDRAPTKAYELHSWLGILRDETGAWKDGETAHRKALELGGKSGFLHNNLGYNLLRQGRLSEAATEFEAALRLAPSSEVTRNNLALALAGKPDAASQREAVLQWQSMSDPASAHNNLAASLMERGELAAARRELDIALGYNKSHAPALRNLQLVAGLDGRPVSIPVRPVRARARMVKRLLHRIFIGGPMEVQPVSASLPKAARLSAPRDSK